MRKENDALAVTLDDNKMAVNTTTKKLEQEELKSLVLLPEFKHMEEEQSDVQAERELLRISAKWSKRRCQNTTEV